MDDLMPCEHQVAGWHNGSLSSVLKNKVGQILKPVKLNANPTYEVSSACRTNRNDKDKEELVPVCRDEKEFYDLVKKSTRKDDLALKPLIPKYYGCQSVTQDNGQDVPHLILQDLAYGFSLPCVMDIKIGVSQEYPRKSKASDKTRYATQDSLGFCLTGIRVFDPSEQQLVLDLRPDSCKQLTIEEVFSALDVFIQSNGTFVKFLPAAIVVGLQKIRQWMLDQRSYKIRRGSVLILYDAGDIPNISAVVDSSSGNVGNESPDEEHHEKLKVVVKMIDFAHVFHAYDEQDDNYIIGLDNLIKFFNKSV